MAAFLNLPLSELKTDLMREGCECSSRGLLVSAKCRKKATGLAKDISRGGNILRYAESVCGTFAKVELLELASSLPCNATSNGSNYPINDTLIQEYDKYMLAKTYFDTKEFKRAMYHARDLKSQKGKFLKLYSAYMSCQQEKWYRDIKIIGGTKKPADDSLLELKQELQMSYDNLDSYCLWLYAVVLKKLDLCDEAIKPLISSLEKNPLFWGAWDELSLLCRDREMMKSLTLPDHWMLTFFEAQVSLDMHLHEEALQQYTELSNAGFRRSIYIQSQFAMAHYGLKNFDEAVNAFKVMQKEDPCRLEHVDAYSNVLYIQNDRSALSLLAHHVSEVDKYKPESCCVIGNYYSLSGEHEKALLYFRQALRLNDQYVAVWTLLGHEYVELKNIPAAVEAYRKATEVNPRDYRAWYGLGQTYELLKMPFYSLYYYKEAHRLRPNDFRMLVALGDTYQSLDMSTEAKLCFWRAVRLGDCEGQATVKLAKVLELTDEDEAATLYANYVDNLQLDECPHPEDAVRALSFLARYHLKKKDFVRSKAYSRKAATMLGGKKEAENLMEEITRQLSLKV